MGLAAPPAITGNFVLTADTVFLPVAEMDDAERARLGGVIGDVVLTRLTARSRSKLVDSQTARLARRFETPNGIASAVIAESLSISADPEALLERAHPMFEQLISWGFLVPEGAPEASAVEPELLPGTTWRGVEVIRVIQSLDDVDVYQARAPLGLVALKRARKGADAAATALVREAKILRLLDGTGVPALVDEFRAPATLAIEWCDGVDADRAAARLRALPSAPSRSALLDLLRSVAVAYATVHRRGVVHGDVHPRNVVIDATGTARLIDFGRATAGPRVDGGNPGRAGAGYFFEPEYARARLAGHPHLPATALGEQQIVGHLLYRLVTGHGYQDFPAGEQDAMRALAKGTPEPFEHWGLAPWDALERVLQRALAPAAADRYADMTALSEALEAIDAPVDARTSRRREPVGVEAALARFDPAGRSFAAPLPRVPRCSITFGAAGVALFLQRLAAARDSPEILSWARVWIDKALGDADRCGDEAYLLPAAGLRHEVVGTASVQHSASGLHVVQATIARAMGDVAGERRAVEAFARAAGVPVESPDVAFGRAGLLLAWSAIREGTPQAAVAGPLDVGMGLTAGLVADLVALPSMSEAVDFPFAGQAHGWAGVLHALLAWCEVSGTSVPEPAVDRLVELASLAETVSAGLRWPIHLAGRERGQNHMRGWCNGSAGLVLLFTQAARTLREPLFLGLAERAGEDACRAPDDPGHLCCGSAGQAYAALALHRATGEARWLAFARRVADDYAGADVASGSRFESSLLKGPLGGQLLAAEVEAGHEEARMPLFELAGWA